MTDEEQVRAVWESVAFEEDFGFHFWLGGRSAECPYLYVEEQDGLPSAWSAARAFTEQRLEEIRQLDEEIALAKDRIDVELEAIPRISTPREDRPNAYAVLISTVQKMVDWGRIVLRLQAIRDGLTNGMKEAGSGRTE